MKNLIEKINNLKFLIGILVSLVGGIWCIFNFYTSFTNDLKVIQKATLRNTIWNDTIPLHDRLESCDSYLELGYNSETKKYCNKLLERVN